MKNALLFRVGLVLVLSSGCEGAKSPDAARVRKVHAVPAGTSLRLAFVTNNNSDFWTIAKKGIQKAEKELGIQVDFKAPNPGSIEEQQRILEDLESQGYHGIAISVLHPTHINRLLNRLAGRMNVLTHDSDAPGSNRLVYIGTNNFAAGAALGKEIVKIFPKGAKMAVFVGTFSADNARQRFDGILKSIKDSGLNFEVVARKEDDKDPIRAKKNVEDVLNAFPDLDLLVGLWSYNGPAIASALKSSGKQDRIKVVCFDEEEPTLQAIKDGLIACTIAQKPFQFGYQSSVLLKKLCGEGEKALPADEVIDTGVTVVAKDNVDAFWADLREQKK